MSKRVFVTGLGIISSIGKNVEEVLDSLLNSRTGIGKVKILNTIHRDIPIGEVPYNQSELAKLANLPDSNGFTRTSLLGIIAANEAVKNALLNTNNDKKTALISATTVGGMCSSEDLYKDFLNNDFKNNLLYIDTHDGGDSTEKIAEQLGLKGFITTISTACSSSANAIMLGSRLIKNNIADRVIVGGTDALSKFTLNGFNTLMILDKELCKPFDENRVGLNIGEGAAYMVIESEDSCKQRNAKIYCEVKGYGNANDAFHQTASSPDGFGASMAMQKALTMSGLTPEMIDYINVHGTGTPNNDLSEGKALVTVFNNKIPFFSSTKSFTGHTLGAAGAVEAIISTLAMNFNFIPPNLNFKNTISELGFSPVSKLLKDVKVNNILSNSFGFGGNNTSLIFSAVK